MFGCVRSFLFVAACVASSQLGAQEVDPSWTDCTSDVQERVISGCSTLIATASRGEGVKQTTALANRAAAYLKIGKKTEALEDLHAAVKLEPSNPDLLYNRAVIYISAGQPKSAVADLTKALSGRRDFAKALAARADAYVRLSDLKRAASDYEQALRLSPKMAFALFGRGNLYRRQGKIAEALTDFRSAIDADPKYSMAYVAMGDILSDQGQFDQALNEYDSALREKADNAQALNNRSSALWGLGRFEDAIADAEAALRLEPSNLTFQTNLATLYLSKGETKKAEIAFALILTAKPNHLPARKGRAIARLAQYDNTAFEDLTALITAEPTNADYYRMRGSAYLTRGMFSDASKDFTSAIKFAPTAEDYLKRARAQVELNKTAEAETDLATALKMNPVSGQIYLERAKFRRLQGREREALDDFRRATELAPELITASLPPPKVDAAPQKVEAVMLPPQLNRVALIIGNSLYKYVPTLSNPVKDARAIAAAFQQVGFKDVRVALDLDRAATYAELRNFAAMAENADWAVVYYAGHGIEIAGVNYMLPTDTKLSYVDDIEAEAVPLPRILTATQGARELRLIILDACRENPFIPKLQVSSRAVLSRGLARVEPDSGTLIAYSARAGQLAMDGDGEHSPYVTALLSRLNTPGLDLHKVFGLVHDDVMKMTGRRQEPFTYGSLGGGDYIINPSRPSVSANR